MLAGRRAIDNEGDYKHLKVAGERVDSVVHENVALLKMDVEGFEPHVLESARGLSKTARPKICIQAACAG